MNSAPKAPRSLPPEIKVLLALLAILVASWGISLALTGLRRLNAVQVRWMGGIGLGLAGACAAFNVLRRTARRKFGREIELQTAGATRREQAEREREYKRKWRYGVDQLRQSGKSLYELPWYMIVGEPGGGKTRALINSGMDFPLGKDELPGFGGTRNYNWWFTNDAVILDTAGRLVFNEEGSPDRKEWQEFLATLRQRRNCPINGVIVTLPADRLLTDDTQAREQAATVLRDHLRHVQQTLGVRFPVYLLITKVDLVAGFTEFFGHCDALQRHQIFGWSRPGAFDAAFDPTEFPKCFDDLRQRLDDLRLRFVAGEQGIGFVEDSTTGAPVQRAGALSAETGWVFTFPEGFKALSERLAGYVNVIFGRNVFAEPLFFRGFYFTSAMQEGKPILDVLGGRLAKEDLQDLKNLYPQSRSYFLYDFFTKKLAPEQGLVFRSARQIQRSRALKVLTYWVMLPLLSMALLAFTIGYVSLARALRGPRENAETALLLIRQLKNDVTGRAAVPAGYDVPRLLSDLSADERRLRQGGRLGGLLLLADSGAIADLLVDLRRELFGHALLRPKVRQIESALAGSGATESALTTKRFPRFRAALLEYLSWSGGRRGVDSSFGRMTDLLDEPLRPDAMFLEQLRQFEVKWRGDVRTAFQARSSAPDGVIATALQRAAEYARGRIASTMSPAGQRLAMLEERCAAAEASFGTLLGAAEAYAASAAETARAAAERQWTEACASGDRGCGAAWLAPLEQALAEVNRAATTGAATEQAASAIREAVESFWRSVIAEIEATPASAEQAGLARLARSHTDACMAELDSQKSSAGDSLKSCEQAVSTGSGSNNGGLALSDAVQARRAFLDDLDQLIRTADPTSDPSSGRLKTWLQSFQPVGADGHAAAACAGGAAALPERLRTVCAAVAEAHQRRSRREALKGLARALAARPTPSLSQFAANAETLWQVEGGASAGSTPLHVRNQARCLLDVMADKLALSAALQRRESRPGVEAEQVERVLADLDASMAAYAAQYLREWGAYCESAEWPGLGELARVRGGWRDFRKAVVAGRPADTRLLAEIWSAYARHAAHLREHVVELVRPAGPSPAATSLAALLRDAAADASSPAFTRWLNARVRGTAAPDLESGAAAWRRFAASIAQLPEQLKLDDLVRTKPELPDLRTALGDEGDLAVAQLQWVIDLAAALLEAEASEVLRSTLQTFGEDRPFPFAGGAPTFPRRKISPLLDQMAQVRAFVLKLRPASGTASTPESSRDRFLAQADTWRSIVAREAFGVRVTVTASDVSDAYRRVTLACGALFDSVDKPLDASTIDFASQAGTQIDVVWKPRGGLRIALADASDRGDKRDDRQRGANAVTLVDERFDDLGFLWFLRTQCEAIGSDVASPAQTGAARFRKAWSVDSPRPGGERRSSRSVTIEIELTDPNSGAPLALPELLDANVKLDALPPPKPPWER